MERIVPSSLSGWPFHFKGSIGSLIHNQEWEMGTVQSTTVITVHFMASPLPLDTSSGRWMVIVSHVRKIMWSGSERIWPLNFLSRLTLCIVPWYPPLVLQLLVSFFTLFLSSLLHIWSILQLPDLNIDAVTHRLGRQICAHENTLYFFALLNFLEQEGQGNVPIQLLALVLSMYQSPLIQL